MEALYSYITEEQMQLIIDIQKETWVRQQEHVSMSRIVRYALYLLEKQKIEDIILGIRGIE